MTEITKDNTTIQLSDSQEDKYNIIKDVENGIKTKQRASALLHLSIRQINRLIIKFKTEGKAGFVHKNTGRVPKNKISNEIKNKIIQLYTEVYDGSNFTHFCELLKENENIKVSRTYVSSILSEEYIHSPKAFNKTKRAMKKRIRELNKQKEKPKVLNDTFKEVTSPIKDTSLIYSSRPRRKYFGELIQLDASQHIWFGDKHTYLHAAIDDASGMIVGAYFASQETLDGYYNVFHQILTNYGIPYEFFTDKRTIFEYTSSKVKNLENDTFTQFSSACHKLGVSITTSSVAQKKGRVERLFGTLQSRLVTELKYNKVTTLEDANKFLSSYIHKFNAQFSITNFNISNSKFEPIGNIDLNVILSVNSIRKINNGYHFKYNNKYYIPVNMLGNPVHYPIKTEVVVIKAFDDNIYVSIGDNVYATQVLNSHDIVSKEFDTPTTNKEKYKYIPPKDHIWRKNSFLKFIDKIDLSHKYKPSRYR